MSIGATAGFNIQETFSNVFQNINDKGKQLNDKLDSLTQSGNLNQEDMLQMQFQIGQYNAMMEALSSVTKSMTDMMKSLAQRAN